MANPDLSRRAAHALNLATNNGESAPGPQRTAFVNAIDKATDFKSLAAKWQNQIIAWEKLPGPQRPGTVAAASDYEIVDEGVPPFDPDWYVPESEGGLAIPE